MKVGNPDKPVSTPEAVATALEAAAKATGQAAPRAIGGPALPDASATVEFSSAASTLLATGGSPEFDTEKVARMSAAIADGTFKIDPGAIADKLIANAQELLTTSKP